MADKKADGTDNKNRATPRPSSEEAKAFILLALMMQLVTVAMAALFTGLLWLLGPIDALAKMSDHRFSISLTGHCALFVILYFAFHRGLSKFFVTISSLWAVATIIGLTAGLGTVVGIRIDRQDQWREQPMMGTNTGTHIGTLPTSVKPNDSELGTDPENLKLNSEIKWELDDLYAGIQRASQEALFLPPTNRQSRILWQLDKCKEACGNIFLRMRSEPYFHRAFSTTRPSTGPFQFDTVTIPANK